MIIKYKTGSTSFGVDAKITPVEAERETDVSVWVRRGRNGKFERHNKISQYEIYHDTWELAHQHLKDRAISQVESAERSLEDRKLRLANVCLMVNPDSKSPSAKSKRTRR